jgi:hypothetical protein
MEKLLEAARAKVEAARLLQETGKDTGELLLQEAAELNEKGEAFGAAVLIYIELGDTKGIRRVTPNVLSRIGASDLGIALDKFSKLDEGSKEEAIGLSELKKEATRFVEATNRLNRSLRKGLANLPEG